MSSPLLERITPLIRQILQAPNVVPSEVSAKTVRKSLIDEHNINKDELSAEKDAVKTLILGIFQELYPDEGTEEAVGGNDTMMNDATPVKKKHPQIAASQASASVAPSSPGVPLVTEKQKKRKRASPAADEMDEDEDLARKLHQSFNTERSTRGSASGSRKKRAAVGEGGGKGKKSRVKSKATIDDEDGDEDGEDNGDGEAKKKKKKARTTGDGTSTAKGGFSKPMILR